MPRHNCRESAIPFRYASLYRCSGTSRSPLLKLLALPFSCSPGTPMSPAFRVDSGTHRNEIPIRIRFRTNVGQLDFNHSNLRKCKPRATAEGVPDLAE